MTATDDERAAFARLLDRKDLTIRDLDIDALADGVMAHRAGKGFHENPLGNDRSILRYSWSFGWNERALAKG
jgi:hypothetical protein